MDGWIPKEEQDKLRGAAPCLFLSWEASWRDHLRLIGEFVDKTKVAGKWLQTYDKKVAEIRDSFPSELKTDKMLVVHVYHNDIGVWGRLAGTVLYDDLRLQPASGLQEFPWTKSVQVTQLAEFEADRLIVNISKDSLSQATWVDITKGAAWRELTAVKNGKVHITPGYAGWESPWNEHAAFNCERLLQQFALLFDPSM